MAEIERNMPAPNNYVFMTIWIAKLLPTMLVFLCAFITYIFVKPLSVDWLLGEKNAPLIVTLILIMYCFLLLLMVASFLRLVYVTYCEPPYVPLGNTHPLLQNNASTMEHQRSKVPYIPPGLENFYQKDVFITDQTGRPRWCFSCANWKPDRAHHCSQADRCIRKMDHFCPWVGGPVGENNYKFFIQFTSYGALYCAYVVSILVVVVLKKQKNKAEHVDKVFYIAIGLISFFLFFSGYMALHSIWLTVNNLTQVENFRRRNKTYYLAIHVPPKEKLCQGISPSNSKSNYAYITYPFEMSIAPMSWPTHPIRPQTSKKSIDLSSVKSNMTATILPENLSRASPSYTIRMDNLENSHTCHGPPNPDSEYLASTIGATTNDESHSPKSGISESSAVSKSLRETSSGPSTLVPQSVWPNFASPHPSSRTFAILKTNCRENPWDLGSYMMNWKTVMGENILDWCFPIRESPCCHHDSSESLYHFGSVVDSLRSAVG